MNEIPLETFLEAVEDASGTAVHTGSAAVRELFEGEVVWEGEVLTFNLTSHPEATSAYAWEAGGEITVVLGVPPVDSPEAAVQASILAAGEGGPEAS